MKELFSDDFEFDEVIGLNEELIAKYLSEFNRVEKKDLLIVTKSIYESSKIYNSLVNYNKNVFLFPMDDFLVSEAFAISPELKINRLETMIELSKNTESRIVITNLMGYLRFLPSMNIFKNNTITIEKNKEVDFEELKKKILNIGYKKESIVNKTGDVAIRGYVIDIFPLTYDSPVRIEFWGDTIDSVRYIDINTQRSIEEIDNFIIYPNTETLLDDYSNIDILNHKDIINYIEPVSIEKYLNKPVVIYNEYNELKIYYEQLVEEMIQFSHSNNLRNVKYMNDLVISDYIKYISKYDNNLTNNKKAYSVKNVEFLNLNAETINTYLNKTLKANKIIIICVNNRYQANKLLDYLKNDNLLLTNSEQIYKNKINIIIKKIEIGYIINEFVVISANEIFKTNHKTNFKSKFKIGTKIKSLSKLSSGDYVVHHMYGIGQYLGIKTLNKNGFNRDYITLLYKGNDKLYLPVEKLEMISKYASDEGQFVKINSLKGNEWSKTKARVKNKIETMALDLLKLYAKREASVGYAFEKDTEEQVIFENQFGFKETKDQLKVIDEIKSDMERKVPMDRLLCGDVGFGKTEIAFRSIFKAIMGGKQAALLCPTTILSQQHYDNAINRFSEFGCRVEILNRFITKKKVEDLKKALKSGSIDFLIGTHRILSNDIEFKDLGLLVVDEEQRFGVTHKEKIKDLKKNVDVLTLSATPIPRTLQMSLTGIRNLSLIETPPTNRYPIQTYVMAKNKILIKEAIYKELSRKGQIFILQNSIELLDITANEIKELVPDARVITAHGQMSKNELEKVMIDFTNCKYDVLICTTIIETGIDIPNVNTLIVEDANKFGLSQLYQLRGRVGRSDRIAYCYLMYNPNKILSEIAQKRLNVIKDFTELGSGFNIAMRDLSLRGAGDILGEEQSGFVESVGVELFMKMLQIEINRLKGKEMVETEEFSQPLLEVSTAVKDKYTEDEDLKIYIHKIINSIDSKESLNIVKSEIEDRFGKIDNDMLIYMHEEWFEKLANKLKIRDVVNSDYKITITLPAELSSKINGEKLFMDSLDICSNFKFTMKYKKLIIILDYKQLEKHYIYYLIDLMKIINNSII